MSQIQLSIGKYRRLLQCSTALNALSILSLDHRSNLRGALNPQSPESVRDAELVEFKRQVVSAVSPAASAALLDPQYSTAQNIISRDLPADIGLIISLEAPGYNSASLITRNQIFPGWNAEKALRSGATGVKLLVYYDPEAETAGDIASSVKQVAAECAACDLPLFLEIPICSNDPHREQLPDRKRRQIVIEAARQLVGPGVDVLKAELPAGIQTRKDVIELESACADLSATCCAPWVLLSDSVDFAVYIRQVEIALRAGASGVAAGQAIWKEATMLNGEKRLTFLATSAHDRMQRLTGLCNALARPWTEFYAPMDADPNWYQ
jgi:tagatose 1,6-diphosphate aldolase